MLYRVLFGVAAASCLYLLIERSRRAEVFAAAHKVADTEADFDRISDVLLEDSERHGFDGKCTVHGGVALVLASRRAHDAIALSLHRSRAARALLQIA